MASRLCKRLAARDVLAGDIDKLPGIRQRALPENRHRFASCR
jgi:hypothetical protein